MAGCIFLFLIFLSCQQYALGYGTKAGSTFTTTPEGPRMDAAVVNWTSVTTAADVTFIFDQSDRQQTIEGFGAAFTEASAYNYNKLKPMDQAKMLSMYFGEEGNRYNLCRIPINSCDFSVESYTFDDNDGAPDPDLVHFDDNVTKDVDNGMIPLILAATKSKSGSANALKFFASPWSPPSWMKRGDHALVGSEDPCLKDDPQIHQAWADYFVRWLAAYRKKGIDVWGVTAQNEPGFVDNTRWEACTFNATHQRDFIRDYLGPAMSGVGVNLIAYDDDKTQLIEWADTILGDEGTAPFVWGLGLHWYAGEFPEKMAAVNQKYNNTKLLATEGCTCIYDGKVYNTTWSRAKRYAHAMITDFNNGVVGWVDWNLLVDTSGPMGTGGPNHAGNTCFAHMHIDVAGTLIVHDSYWAFGHFSRFVPRGSRRIASSLEKGGKQGVLGTVFELPTGKVVAILLNENGDTAGERNVKLWQLGSSSAVVVNVPADSIVTVVLNMDAEVGLRAETESAVQ